MQQGRRTPADGGGGVGDTVIRRMYLRTVCGCRGHGSDDEVGAFHLRAAGLAT